MRPDTKTPHYEPTANRDEIETNPTKTTDERTRETANRQEQDKRKLSAKTRKTQCV